MTTILTIALSAACGALLRWGLGSKFNPLFPTIPLGTLMANLLGGLLIGLFIGYTKHHAVPGQLRLGIVTGFLGSLTTFSTFSAETVTLLSHQEYGWSLIMIGLHVVGSLCATLLGMYIVKLLPI